jgi:hypothetical protein
MALYKEIQKGSTGVTSILRILDNSSGEPISAGIALAGRLWYWRENNAISEVAHSANCLLHIKNGYHRCDFPDAAFSAGAENTVLLGYSAVSAVAIGVECSLVDHNPVTSIEDISANVATLDTSLHTMSANLSLKHTGHSANLNLILADTNELQTDDIPGTLATMSAGLATNVATNTTTIDTRIATLSANQQTSIADAVWDEVLTGATHAVADSSGRRLRDLQEFGTYEDGAIWIDTVNGTAGTTDYESGTVFNPVDTIADANTLATSLGLSRFKVAPGSSITLAAAQVNQEFLGSGWTLALGGQNIAGTLFEGATVSGIGTGADPRFTDCQIGSVTLANCRMVHCMFTGTITMSAASDYYFDSCYSGVAGAGTPVIDFGAAVANSNLSMRHYSGGIQINNKDGSGTDQMSLEGDGQLIVAASSSGAISLRGNFTVTNTGGATITYDDDTAGIQTLSANAASISANVVTLTADLHTMSANLSLKHTGHSANLNLILADTNELQTDDIPGRLDTVDTALATLSANAASISANVVTLQSTQNTMSANLTDDIAGITPSSPTAMWQLGIVSDQFTANSFATRFATMSANMASISANVVTLQSTQDTMSANLTDDIAAITPSSPTATWQLGITSDQFTCSCRY